MPVEAPTDAIDALLLVHEPPSAVLLKVVTEPTHTVVVPVIAGGIACTVIALVEKHPVGSV
jgi:hypothetical protein